MSNTIVNIGAPSAQTQVSVSSADIIYVSVAAGFTGQGGGGGGANLSTTRTATTVTVVSDSGTDATIAAADGTNAGVMTAAMKLKLDGIEAGAEVNDTASEILTKLLTVDGSGSGLDADTLDGNNSSAFAAASHTHIIGDVTGLQTALDGKAATIHTHVIGDVTNLQTTLDGKVDENAAITGATKTKITYDAKGLVTAGADATTADIADSTNKRYVTDAQLTVIGNTSGTNTGDQNLFSTIAVAGQSNVVADGTGDTLTLVAGSNITITTDATTDSVTIASTGGGSGVSDGDKGDITVSSSGTVWTVDNDAITYAKIQNVSATSRILGRITSGAGDIEELTGTQATTLLDTFTSSLKGLAPASGGGTTNFLRADGTWAAPSGGGGSGTKTYAVFTPTDNQPPASAFATLDTRNSIAVLDFDSATDESAVFVGIIPEAASLGSGLKIRLHWAASTATSGDCRWDVQLERMTTDMDSDSFDTIASATANTNGTSGIITVTEITLTTIDSVTAGDGFRLKVTRDANNAADTMSGDAELVIVEVRSAA